MLSAGRAVVFTTALILEVKSFLQVMKRPYSLIDM